MGSVTEKVVDELSMNFFLEDGMSSLGIVLNFLKFTPHLEFFFADVLTFWSTPVNGASVHL